VLKSLKAMRKAKNQYFTNRNNVNRQQLKLANQNWYKTVHEVSIANYKTFCSTLNNNKKIYWKTWSKSKPSEFTPLIGICKDKSDQLPTTTEQSLQNLCDYFASVSTSTNENELSTEKQTLVNQFINQPISISSFIDDELLIEYDVIEKCCKHIPTDTALGADKTSPFHIKYGGKSLYQCFYILFNLCFISGILPTDWTSANIFALHKSGDKTQPGNFRPIALTSIVVRLYERIIYPKVLESIKRNNILNKYQFGFREQRSTMDNIYIIISNIYKALHNNKKNTSKVKLPIMYLDLKKAFDSINIDATLYKLSQAGIKGRLYLFFNAFLSNRKIRTMFMNDYSDWRKIDMGTPQGSVLGPLIFLIYINDLLNEIEATGNMIPSAFADDIALIPTIYNQLECTFQNLIITMQQSLNICTKWAKDWGMKFSAEKSNIVIYRNRKKLTSNDMLFIDSLKLANFTVIMKPTYKYLGIDLDEIGTSLFNTHIDRISKKASQVGYLVKRLFQNDIPIQIGRLLTNATVRSIISYALPMIRVAKHKLEKLESQLVKPLRRILGLPGHASNKAVLFECNIPPVHIIRDYLLLRTAHRYSQLPPNHTAKNIFYSDYLEQKTKTYDRHYLPRNYNYRSIAFELLELENVDKLLHGYKQNSGKLCWKPIHHATTNKLELYHKMKTLCEIQWTERETKCKSLRKIKTEFSTELYHVHDPPAASKLRARLRLNVSKNNEALFKRKFIETDQCPTCTNIIESREHVLLDCPRYDGIRNNMIKALNDIGINTTNIPAELILGVNTLGSTANLFIQTLLITSLFITQIQMVRVF
jgi:hypothetical protein